MATFAASAIKLRRAEQHLSELEREVSAYFGRKAMVMVNEMASIGLGSHSWTVRIREPIPELLSAIIGDLIHNLRSALDLMACALVAARGYSTKNVYFPFCENQDELAAMIRKRKFDRAGPEAVKRVRHLRPFRGGNRVLRAIHDLDIKDKHSALIPVASAAASPSASVSFSAGQMTDIPEIRTKIDRDGQPVVTTIPIPGLTLGAEIPASFSLLFGFDQAEFEGYELVATLRLFIDDTASVIRSFEDLLK